MKTDSGVTLSVDPYNWKAVNKKDAMYLSTITKKDEITKNLKGITTRRSMSTNLTNLDIPGKSKFNLS